jgi:GNAT superfamily N-acetyltransferase
MEMIEAIERATLDAMPPQRLAHWGEWLLPFDDGTVGRSHSTVPLRHATPPPETLTELERRYRAQSLPLVLRLPEIPAFEALQAQLDAQGYRRAKPTLVQVGTLAALASPHAVTGSIEVTDRPGADWEQVFLGEGFDPVDGASRLGILRRGSQSVFAGLRVDGRIVAVGSACVSHGWCGLHGMRTLPAWRGRACASALIASLGRAAGERGATQCFLQVDASNAIARSLYAQRGFTTSWAYAYWQR